MGYDFKYKFVRKTENMEVCAEDILRIVKEQIDNGNCDVTVIGDENGDTGQRSYEIPKEPIKIKRPFTELYFVSDAEHREIIFTGIINGRVKDPGGYDKLFNEKAIIYLRFSF